MPAKLGVGLSKTTAVAAFRRLTSGLFFRGGGGGRTARPPASLCLQAVCRSILITIQIVIDLPSPGPEATRSHSATLGPIETANTAGPAGLSARLSERPGGRVSRTAAVMDG